jgi:trans-2,3-dihydro-3-hydroxyanthranilate isomerase
MNMQFYMVDVFAEQKYQGNQLAVFVLNEELSDNRMQQIAREVNFSETTFIGSARQKDGSYDVRVFSPAVELPFAGHPVPANRPGRNQL